MISKLKLLILFVFMLNLSSVVAQHKIGLKFNAGASKFARNYSLPHLQNTFLMSSNWEPSILAGVFYEFNLPNNFFMSGELLYNQVNTNEYFESPIFDQNGDEVGKSYFTITSSCTFISLPVLLGFRVKRLSLIAGFQYSQIINSNGLNEGGKIENGIETDKWSIDLPETILENDFGVRFGFLYNFTKKISAEANYCHGLKNLAPEPTIIKIRQMTVGLRYAFIDLNKSK